VLAAPLTPETEGMINAETLAMVKPGAWLINVARGRLVDERALLRALVDGDLGGAVPRHLPRRAAGRDLAVLRHAQRHRERRIRLGRAAGSSTAASSSSATTCAASRPVNRCSTWSTRAPGTDPGHNPRMQIAIVGLAGRARPPSSTRSPAATPRPAATAA
jgi:hypothetical protein